MAVTTGRRIAVRAMTTADLRQVRRIERSAYGANVPRTPFERELENGLAQYLVAVERPEAGAPPADPPRGLAALRQLFHLGGTPEERIVGFLGLWFTIDQLHVVTVAVEPREQGRGIAQRLLLEAYAVAHESELRTIALEVRPSNEAALHLYERYGFTHAGRLRAYYSDNGEDALVMVTPELDTPALLERLESLRAEHAARFGDTFEP